MKLQQWGGGDYNCVKKLASLCLLSVCFYGCFRSYEKLGLPPPPKKKYWREASELAPLFEGTWLMTQFEGTHPTMQFEGIQLTTWFEGMHPTMF